MAITMNKCLCITLIFLNVSCFFIGTNWAQQLQPAHIFNDHMVLQREKAVPIWGMGSPAEHITVIFASQTKKPQAGADGKWMVRLDSLEASSQSSRCQ